MSKFASIREGPGRIATAVWGCKVHSRRGFETRCLGCNEESEKVDDCPEGPRWGLRVQQSHVLGVLAESLWCTGQWVHVPQQRRSARRKDMRQCVRPLNARTPLPYPRPVLQSAAEGGQAKGHLDEDLPLRHGPHRVLQSRSTGPAAVLQPGPQCPVGGARHPPDGGLWLRSELHHAPEEHEGTRPWAQPSGGCSSAAEEEGGEALATDSELNISEYFLNIPNISEYFRIFPNISGYSRISDAWGSISVVQCLFVVRPVSWSCPSAFCSIHSISV